MLSVLDKSGETRRCLTRRGRQLAGVRFRPIDGHERSAHVSAAPRRSITQTHQRIAQLGWEPSYHEPEVRYASRYRFPTKAKDPMKHIMREYLPMELEKDERVYGGQDAAVRADMGNQAQERWLEMLK